MIEVSASNRLWCRFIEMPESSISMRLICYQTSPCRTSVKDTNRVEWMSKTIDFAPVEGIEVKNGSAESATEFDSFVFG